MDDDSQKRISFPKRVYQEIRMRKVRQRVAIYLSAALTILGVTNLFSGVYHLPPVLFDAVLVVLLCGLPCAIVSAWIHGGEGTQKIRWNEIALYGVFLALTLVIVLRMTRMPGARLIPSGEKSVAVLPFVNLSDNKDDEYFSDGVTEDITTQLSKISDLKVISRTSTMHYKNATKSVREIAEELGATHVLEGSIRRAGGRVRIVGQLIEARDDKHVWAETYDRDMSDVFAIQSEVARSIAGALQAALTPGELQRIEKRSTENLEAYGYYLRGREYYYRYTKVDNERAVELFRQALGVDPHYALAYAGVGDAYGLRTTRYGFGREWADSAIAVSTLAISLDPMLAEGYKALGLALDIKGQVHDALQQYYKAVELNPNYAPVVANIGAVNFTLGRYDEALPWVKKATTLQPGVAHYYSLVGLLYFSLGLDSASLHWLTGSLSLQPEMVFPKILLTYLDLYHGKEDQARTRMKELLRSRPGELGALDAAGDVELIASRFDQAREYFKKAAEISGLESPSGAKLSFVLVKLGKRKEAEEIMQRIIAAYDVDNKDYPEGSQIPYVLAQVHAMKQNAVKSVRWLRNAIERGYRDYRWTAVDPLIDNIRSSPEGTAALQSLKGQIDSMREKAVQSEKKP